MEKKRPPAADPHRAMDEPPAREGEVPKDERAGPAYGEAVRRRR